MRIIEATVYHDGNDVSEFAWCEFRIGDNVSIFRYPVAFYIMRKSKSL